MAAARAPFPMPQEQKPDPEMLLAGLEKSLEVALTKDLSTQPSITTYLRIRDKLREAGMQPIIISAILPLIQVAVTQKFVEHPRFDSIITKFAQLIHKVHLAMIEKFDNDTLPLFKEMVKTRFSLLVPLED